MKKKVTAKSLKKAKKLQKQIEKNDYVLKMSQMQDLFKQKTRMM